jgi:hypothetical protein
MSLNLPNIFQTRDSDICIWVQQSANCVEELRRHELWDIELSKHDSGVGYKLSNKCEKSKAIYDYNTGLR